MIEHFDRLFQHMVWADARVLEALQRTADAAALRTYAHLLAAEQVWLTRLRGMESAELPIWPALALRECAALATGNREQYGIYLAALPEEGVRRAVTYRNSKGVEFTSTVSDVLSHVMMHGSYHRGQIAARLRAAGAEPPNTDFITFTREEASSRTMKPAAGGIVLAALLAIVTGCARPATPGTSDERPLVRGAIESIDHRATVSAVHVSGGPGSVEACGIHATVDARTRYLARIGSSAPEASSLGRLTVGDTVEVYVSGPVAESCPVQGYASTVVLVVPGR